MFYGLVIIGDRGDGTIIVAPHRHDHRNFWLYCGPCQEYEAYVREHGHQEIKEAQEGREPLPQLGRMVPAPDLGRTEGDA